MGGLFLPFRGRGPGFCPGVIPFFYALFFLLVANNSLIFPSSLFSTVRCTESFFSPLKQILQVQLSLRDTLLFVYSPFGDCPFFPPFFPLFLTCQSAATPFFSPATDNGVRELFCPVIALLAPTLPLVPFFRRIGLTLSLPPCLRVTPFPPIASTRWRVTFFTQEMTPLFFLHPPMPAFEPPFSSPARNVPAGPFP